MEKIDWKKATTELSKKLDPSNVKDKSGVKGSFVEGWHVISEANRIFGFGGWSYEISSLILAGAPYKNQNDNHVVNYICQIRVSVGDIVREDTGFGSGIAGDLGAAHEGATKEAVTDALKRALRTFGNQFGLALYDKERANVGYDEPPEEEANEIWGRLLVNLRKDLEGVDLDDHQTKGKLYNKYWNGLGKYNMQTEAWNVKLNTELNPHREDKE